ncbi:MAG: hypothetical protein FWF94_03055 [Oscillospiraceae bacterium]|nr:hypothetical protein [Oscillospiraceae bacterium]
MAYTQKNVIGEIAGLIILRISCLAACLCFGLPMFYTSIIPNYTLSGFGSILGVQESVIHGTPISLIAFVFPIIILIITFLEFLNENMYTATFIFGIIGFIITVIYFIAETTYLNQKANFFDFNLYDLKTWLSWGSLILLGIYLFITVLSLLCRRNSSG